MNIILYYIILFPLFFFISYIFSVFMVTKKPLFFLMTFVLAGTARFLRKKRIKKVQNEMNADLKNIFLIMSKFTNQQLIEIKPDINAEEIVGLRKVAEKAYQDYECTEDEAKDILKSHGTYSFFKAVRTYSIILTENKEMQDYVKTSWTELKNSFNDNKGGSKEHDFMNNTINKYSFIVFTDDNRASLEYANKKA
ncbi:hypothetical protein [Leuconostoc mesenteroides]|uniref:hypothetical protein n=1 Tax=Leuconostoc mesenteroides TaxID=1245 RepID=UPI00101FBDF4|nr:hypothetical protein [Leuconostoc mesenteroides]QBC39841.1 hypothetical protein EQK02_06205 [Leuconostoc mesenteroides]